MFNGILIIDKTPGMTSHDVVNRIRRIFKTKRVGHTGTLDPEATGVLVLCLGNALRLAEYLSASQKLYIAEVMFGTETDTQDIWGSVTAEYDASVLTEADLIGSLARFRGTIYQVPPMVSARRFEGKHLYELARKGVTVEREARPIEIYRLEMTRFSTGERPTAELEVSCSTGTYIRTLAFDIGRALGVGAAMSALRRTCVGSGDNAFTLEQAYTFDELTKIAEAGPERLARALLPVTHAVLGWPRARIDDALEARIRHGHAITLAEAGIEGQNREDGLVALLDLQADLIAVAKLTESNTLQPVKVLGAGG